MYEDLHVGFDYSIHLIPDGERLELTKVYLLLPTHRIKTSQFRTYQTAASPILHRYLPRR